MKRFLIGTAGHIDHGKTALVKALTGIDADRLPEEKKRGITIDLGFAHAEWEGARISFVDVPGHERFVRNMLAGAGGIQAVLLVVAADESVMPQTREHFEIVRLLDLSAGAIAVTKIDRVPTDLVAVTISDVKDLVSGSFLENAPILPVSARSGEGLEQLKAALVSLAQARNPEESEALATRLPIDRAFLVAGFGPVVTGSLVSGTIAREQKLDLLPDRKVVRVRRIEVHGREEEVARAGERVSANLAGVELSDLRRGQMLATPDRLALSRRLLARLELLPDAPRLTSGSRVSVHHFSSEARAGVRLLDTAVLEPGESGRVELRFSSLIAAAPGDRFVVRRLSPVRTIGGGVIIDPLPARRRGRGDAEAAEALDRLEAGSLSERLALWIEEARERGADEDSLAQRAGVSAAAVKEALAAPLAERRVHALRRDPGRYMAESALKRLASKASAALTSLASSEGPSVGVSRSTLLRRIVPSAEPRWAEAIEKALAERGVLVTAGEEARVPGRDDLAAPQKELSEKIAALYRQRGLEPPSPGEAAAAVRHHPKVVEGLIGYLVKRGALLRLPGGWFIAREAVDDVVSRLRASGKTAFEVPEFKQMFGLTRRIAIPLLEYLDGAKVTRRVGDRREILRG